MTGSQAPDYVVDGNCLPAELCVANVRGTMFLMEPAMRLGRKLSLSIAAVLTLAPLAVMAQGAPPGMPQGGQAIMSDAARLLPVIAPHGMVASQEAKATRIGVEVLQKGGNAVDAAVAVGFALAVTLPRAGNLGGGGFMLVHLAERNETLAIDYRETAPAAATRDLFLDEKSEPDPRKSRDTGLSVGVPGTVRG